MTADTPYEGSRETEIVRLYGKQQPLTDDAATPRPIEEDPDEAFATWHYLEFGFRPTPGGASERRTITPTVDVFRSAWEHGRQFERKLIAERSRRAIRETREEIRRTQDEILKEVERGREDTGRAD